MRNTRRLALQILSAITLTGAAACGGAVEQRDPGGGGGDGDGGSAGGSDSGSHPPIGPVGPTLPPAKPLPPVCAGTDPATPPPVTCYSQAQIASFISSIEACAAANKISVGTLEPNNCPGEHFGRDFPPGPCNNSLGDSVYLEADQCCYYVCPPNIIEGRPLIVDGAARVAETTERGDWGARTESPTPPIDDVTQAALAASWLESARYEHASIASFARFALQLLAVGAPSDLIRDAQRAGLDEIEHARLCFALASRFGKKNLGPACLDVGGVSVVTSLASAAAETVIEGCIGETVAASLAMAEHDGASDPAVRSALAVIARDEAQHAELAWRFVAWAIAEGGDEVRSAVARAFTVAPPQGSQESFIGDEVAWSAHGRLTAKKRDAVVKETWHDVIGPCARALGASCEQSHHAAERLTHRAARLS